MIASNEFMYNLEFMYIHFQLKLDSVGYNSAY